MTLDAELTLNQKFVGLISSAADEDAVQFSEVVGSKLTIVVKRKGGNLLDPEIELLDGSEQPIDVGAALQTKDGEARIVGFVTPYTGTYILRIASANSLTGKYTVSIKGKPVGKVAASGNIGAPAEIDSVEFAARAGARLSGTIERVSGDLEPLLVELIGPDSALVAIAGKSKTNAAQSELSFADIPLPQLGDYELRFTGSEGTTGDYQANLTIKSKKPAKGTLFEDEVPAQSQDDGPTVTLQRIDFGRGIISADAESMDVVSPFTLVLFDPITNLPEPGTLKPLFSGQSTSALVDFQLGPLYTPPIVPRNAVLKLTFNREVSTQSLKLGPGGALTPESPLQVSVNGEFVPCQVFRVGKVLILNPVFGDAVGLPPSPLVLDAAGNPVASTTGAGEIVIDGKGVDGLKSAQGGGYKPRADLLGSPDFGGAPIGFNPGNVALDFFEQSSIGAGEQSYGGFLPDESKPRLIREIRFEDAFDPDFTNPTLSDFVGVSQLSVVLNQAFDTAAQGGAGEWAGALLRLRPETVLVEEKVVLSNTVIDLGGGLFRNTFNVAGTIKVPLKDGELYQLARAEYFEPDLDHPIDPELFNPDNPELLNNTDLANFVEARDRDGMLQDIDLPIDPQSSLTFLFSEPMQLESFRPYESFYVSDFPASTDPAINFVGRVSAAKGNKRITYRPEREIQFGPDAGTVENVGFSPVAKPLAFHIRVVPEASVLEGLIGAAALPAFFAAGHRGVTDASGQPLGYTPIALTPLDTIVDFSFPFTVTDDASLSKIGAVVHRFRGRPVTGTDADGKTGVSFGDVPPSLCSPKGNIYGPFIADINLFTNGFLSGAPVQFLQKIHDDFNPPPPPGQFSAFPFGASTPLGGFAVLGGTKFQHVYRAIDASPDFESLAGTILDLVQVGWAPANKGVTNTVLPDLSIHAGHSCIVPDTKQNQGIPSLSNTGLSTPSIITPDHTFGGYYDTLGDPSSAYVDGNYNAFHPDGTPDRRQAVSGTLKPGEVADNYQGRSYTIAKANLVSLPGTQNPYHPLPNDLFEDPFPFDNGARDPVRTFAANLGYTGAAPTWGGAQGDPIPHSLLLEYRVRVVDPNNPPQTNNGFTFAIGILSSAVPRFRVFSYGAGCLACCFDNSNQGNCDNTCSVSFGPAMDGLSAGPGMPPHGQPLEPDRIKFAAGPGPAPPGLSCFCLKPPGQTLLAPAGCTDKTQGPPAVPTIDQVAYGEQPPPSTQIGAATFNNFGDNSRYFMVFNYVKRESTIRSPFVRADATDPTYLAPVLVPPLSQLPVGTTFNLEFRSSVDGLGELSATPFVPVAELADELNPVNTDANSGRFLQFRVVIEGNTSSQLVPAIEEIVIPFRYGT